MSLESIYMITFWKSRILEMSSYSILSKYLFKQPIMKTTPIQPLPITLKQSQFSRKE